MSNHIKITVANILDNRFTNSWQIKLIKDWELIIGKLKSKVHIEKINENSILLGVYDSCWMQELYLFSNIIINKINSRLDQPRIKFIKFKLTSLKKNSFDKIKKIEKKEIRKIEPSSIELFALNKIKDPQLSQALKNFLIKCHEQSKI